MNSCYDPGCGAAAPHELLGLRACTPHYVEALEHSAHIVLKPRPQLQRELRLWVDDRLGVLVDVIAKRGQEKKRSEAETGGPAEYSLPRVKPPAGDELPARPPDVSAHEFPEKDS